MLSFNTMLDIFARSASRCAQTAISTLKSVLHHSRYAVITHTYTSKPFPGQIYCCLWLLDTHRTVHTQKRCLGRPHFAYICIYSDDLCIIIGYYEYCTILYNWPMMCDTASIQKTFVIEYPHHFGHKIYLVDVCINCVQQDRWNAEFIP